MRLGEEMLLARRRLGLTAAEAAERVGLSRQMWSRIECGHSAPRDDTAARIRALLGIPEDDAPKQEADQVPYVLHLWSALSQRDREEMLGEMVRRAIPGRGFDGANEPLAVAAG